MSELYRIVAFYTTTDALAFQSACERRGVPGKLMPIPRQMSAGCGLAWRTPLAQAAQLDSLLHDASLMIEAVCDIEL
ncbi:MAG: DUF3343 domain-containing protein [Raoultibacter sp.]|jgi:hypothetical protein